MRPLLVHEICHAVTDSVHKKKFLTRLRKAYERAIELRDDCVVERLEIELRDLNTGLTRKEELEEFFSNLSEAVLSTDGKRSYDELMGYLAR